MTGSWLAWAALAVQTVALPADPTAPVHLRCPVHETTRIVLPEPLRQLKGSARDKAALDLRLERTRPTAAFTVRPGGHPRTGRLEFRGPSLVVQLVIETTAGGRAAEIRLVPPPAAPAMAAASPPAPTPEPSAEPSPAAAAPDVPLRESAPPPSPEPTPAPPSPTPVPTPTPLPSAPAVPAADAMGMGELVWAQPLAIGRREGLPGQPAMILVDALAGRESIWFRLRLEGGAPTRVSRVVWEQGEITTFQQEPEGKDRRIVVRLPRGRVTARTRLELSVESGPTYRFALNAPTLSNTLKSLFQ